MKLERCNNGHFYDPAKHSSCPHCGIDIDFDIDKTLPISKNNDVENKTAPRVSNANKENQENKTIGIYHKEIGIDPVVGWLVCIEGPDRGRDYRIRSGRNFIGRSEKMDIYISGDRSISREKHGVIIYDPKNNRFLIQPGESREMVYLNEEGIYSATEVNTNDIIELGETKLIFVPLCGGNFKWDEE